MIEIIIFPLILGFIVLAIAFKRMPGAKKILGLFGVAGILLAITTLLTSNSILIRVFHIWSVGVPFLMLFLILGSVD
jgi:hypothetical protein